MIKKSRRLAFLKTNAGAGGVTDTCAGASREKSLYFALLFYVVLNVHRWDCRVVGVVRL